MCDQCPKARLRSKFRATVARPLRHWFRRVAPCAVFVIFVLYGLAFFYAGTFLAKPEIITKTVVQREAYPMPVTRYVCNGRVVPNN